jgi:hypothetical protein
LLTSRSEDEAEGKYARFEESSRWIAEIGGQGTRAKPHTGIEAEDERVGQHERARQQGFENKALTTLDLLDERAEKIGVRLEQIEARMIEL